MVEIDSRGDVAILNMSHGKANALDLELCEALTRRLAELEASAARALVLTGQGRIFSAGVDLVRLLGEGPSYVQAFLPALNRMFEAVFFHPRPVVAAVNGHAIAGGCVIACAGDHRLMAAGPGRIGVPELRVGVAFPSIALEIVRHAAAPASFPALLYDGTTFSPADAATRGLVNEVVEGGDLVERAVEIARRWAALPPTAFALTKAQVRQPVRERVEAARSGIDPSVVDLWATPATRETIRAYVARTLGREHPGPAGGRASGIEA